MPTVAELIDAAIRLAHDCDQDHAVQQLIEQAGNRHCLEEVNDILIARVHKFPTNIEFSRALKLVTIALARLPYPSEQR
jgi:hypothetical protein